MLTLTFYQSGILRRWRWRLQAGNGEKIAQTAQGRGFSRKIDCEENAVLVLTGERNGLSLTGMEDDPAVPPRYAVGGRPDVRVVWE